MADKGLGAALLMAKLQATIRALAPITRSLSDLGARLNEIFYTMAFIMKKDLEQRKIAMTLILALILPL